MATVAGEAHQAMQTKKRLPVVGGFSLPWEDLKTFLQSVGQYDPAEEPDINKETLYIRYFVHWHQSDFKQRRIPIVNYYINPKDEKRLFLPTALGQCKSLKSMRSVRPGKVSFEHRDKFLGATGGAFSSERMSWICVPLGAVEHTVYQ